MPSEKQIDEMRRKHRQNMKDALTAAEQAEPAPAARYGAVKVKPLQWESIDGGNAFRAPALIFGWIRIETYTLHSWQVQWSVPGICNLLMPNVFDSPSAAKAAAQADYERRILAALEPAEPATDAEPTNAENAYVETNPSEARLREALEDIANRDYRDNMLDPNRNKRFAEMMLATLKETSDDRAK